MTRSVRLRLATLVTMAALALMGASRVGAAPGENSTQHGNAGGAGNGTNDDGNAFGHDPAAPSSPEIVHSLPSVAATPELDSLALFGTGAAGIASYGLMRLRTGRRRDNA